MEVGCVFSLLAAKIDTGMHVLPALSDVVYHWPPSGGEELARSEMAWFYPRLVLFVLFFCSFFFSRLEMKTRCQVGSVSKSSTR